MLRHHRQLFCFICILSHILSLSFCLSFSFSLYGSPTLSLTIFNSFCIYFPFVSSASFVMFLNKAVRKKNILWASRKIQPNLFLTNLPKTKINDRDRKKTTLLKDILTYFSMYVLNSFNLEFLNIRQSLAHGLIFKIWLVLSNIPLN